MNCQGSRREKRTLWRNSWEDYDISRNRLEELKAFCRQYNEKRSKIQNGHKDREKYRRDLELMEQAAMKANPEIYQYILKSVANNIPYEQIEYDKELGRISVSRTVFYGYRRKFFNELDKVR